MSAAIKPVPEAIESRRFRRQSIQIALDVIVLRSGVPQNLPGRCTDLSEGGVGGMVAGELAPGQQVALEFRLPTTAAPFFARARVRYQNRLRCGFEFVSMPPEQWEWLRYWARSWASKAPGSQARPASAQEADVPKPRVRPTSPQTRRGSRIRVTRSHFYFLLTAMLLIAAAGWWHWEQSWKELEPQAQEVASAAPLRVPAETMALREISKIDPMYPEEARRAGKEGMVVLDAIIGSNGAVEKLRPVAGDDLLVKAAADAVRQWKYAPYQSSGHAVPVETTITVDFRLK